MLSICDFNWEPSIELTEQATTGLDTPHALPSATIKNISHVITSQKSVHGTQTGDHDTTHVSLGSIKGRFASY